MSNAWPKKIRATGTRRFDTSFIRMDLETNKTYVKVSGPGLWFTSFWGQVSGFKFNMDHDNLRNLFAWRKPRQLVLFHREIEIWNYKLFWKVSVHESVEVHMVLILSSSSRTAFRGILRAFKGWTLNTRGLSAILADSRMTRQRKLEKTWKNYKFQPTTVLQETIDEP